jgi:hypothetical protein
MIPASAAAGAPADCVGTTQPPGRAGDPREILVGRQFFHQFLFSSDCACAAASRQLLVKPTSSVSGPVVGYLIIEVDKGAVAPYQVFEPAANKSFPLQ